VFAQWSDVFWLQSFFKQHKHDLRYGYHGYTSVHKAVNQTTRDVRNMRRRLFELALQGQFDRQNTLRNMFVPLRNEMRLAVLQKSKA
jgi:hypothetical protein